VGEHSWNENRDLGLVFEETRSRQRCTVEVPGDHSRRKLGLGGQDKVITLRPLPVYSLSTKECEQVRMGSREDRTYPLLQFRIFFLSDLLPFPSLHQGCLAHRPFQRSRLSTLAFTLNPVIHLHTLWETFGSGRCWWGTTSGLDR
jgi:hypothetical protein